MTKSLSTVASFYVAFLMEIVFWSQRSSLASFRVSGASSTYMPVARRAHQQMYFVSKTLAEKAAWKYAEENNLEFISIIPSLVVGPFITSSFPPSLITALSPITRTESHYFIIKQGQFVHLDDLCNSHIYLFEDPKAHGRYMCSSHDATIYEVAQMLNKKYPEYNVPTKFEGIDENIKRISFSSKKLVEAGFRFKYSLEDMFVGAVETCREKGLLPLTFENGHVNGTS